MVNFLLLNPPAPCHQAPEVFRHEQYSLKVDVYSYAMIVFQLFENAAPFAGMDPIQAARDAAMMGARPNFPPRNKLDAVEQVGCINAPDALLMNQEMRDGLIGVRSDSEPDSLDCLTHTTFPGTPEPRCSMLGWYPGEAAQL